MQPYELIRSGRRTLALELRGGHVIVRAPYRTPQATIDRFVASHAEWIARGVPNRGPRRRAPGADGRRAGGVHPAGKSLSAAARGVLFRADGPLPDTGAHHGRAHALWQLQLAGAHLLFVAADAVPPEAIDYVVVHELAHLRYMNHGAEFYALIARYLPDWKARRALLQA